MSDSEAVLIQPLTATVGFIRKTAVNGQYNNNELSLYLPVEIPRLADFDGDHEAYYAALDGALKAGFTTAKGMVFDQLGLEFEDKDGVLTEKVSGHFANSTEAPAQARHANVKPAAAPSAPVAGQPAACAGCSGTKFFDNREAKASGKYKANAPDFKCADKACGKGVWTPR